MRASSALTVEPGCGVTALPVRRMRRTLTALQAELRGAQLFWRRLRAPGKKRGFCLARVGG
jgi:hypothetical protein